MGANILTPRLLVTRRPTEGPGKSLQLNTRSMPTTTKSSRAELPNLRSAVYILYRETWAMTEGSNVTSVTIYEGYKEINGQPSKGLSIYQQPRFREIVNRQMTN